MDNLSVGQLSQIGAWGLMLGNAFFGFLGLRAEKDFFLMLGLVCCVMGNVGFVMFLMDQEGEANNETFVTIYILLTIFALYAMYAQWSRWREEGCAEEDDEEEEPAEDEAAAQQRMAAAARAQATNQAIFDKAATGADAAAGAAGAVKRR